MIDMLTSGTIPIPVWGFTSKNPPLDRGKVHLWQAQLDPLATYFERFEDSLSSDERQRAERFRFQRDRRRFIVARALLRILIGRYLQKEPAQVQFNYGPNGKPSLAGDDNAALRFNLSHSEGLALYAVTRGREIGVDVEYIGKNLDIGTLAERFFSPREIAALKSLPDHEKHRAFFACWTRKEAYLKARGDGLSVALDSFSVLLNPDEPPVLLSVEGDPEETSRWSLLELDPGPSYVAALAVEGHNWRLRSWQLTDQVTDFNPTQGC
jgi:4'-phosphopantetheinyl transferase